MNNIIVTLVTLGVGQQKIYGIVMKKTSQVPSFLEFNTIKNAVDYWESVYKIEASTPPANRDLFATLRLHQLRPVVLCIPTIDGRIHPDVINLGVIRSDNKFKVHKISLPAPLHSIKILQVKKLLKVFKIGVTIHTDRKYDPSPVK